MSAHRITSGRGPLRALGSALLRPVLVILAALLAGATIILVIGDNPLEAYRYLVLSSLTDPTSFGQTVAAAVPLVLTGLASAVAFRAGLFNIGLEGQLAIGGLAGAWFALSLPGLPAALLLPGTLLAGALAGGALAGLAGWLRACFGANEVVSTIMLNYVASNVVFWAVEHPLKDPLSGSSQSRVLPGGAHLYSFSDSTQVHAGLVLALLCVVGVFALLYRTALGYELRMVGANPFFARAGGVPVKRVLVLSMLISGMLAGLCGIDAVSGTFYRLTGGLNAPQWGYNGIVVALLARYEPLAIPVAAFGYATLETGGAQMQANTPVDLQVVTVIQGMIILFVTIQAGLDWRRFRRGRPTGSPVAPAAQGGDR